MQKKVAPLFLRGIPSFFVVLLIISCASPLIPGYGSIQVSFRNPRFHDQPDSRATGDGYVPSGFITAFSDAIFGSSGMASRAIDPNTASFIVSVSADDIPQPITTTGSYDPRNASITLTVPKVPVGPNRLLTVTALDSAGGRLTEGNAVISVVKQGSNGTVAVSMKPLNPAPVTAGTTPTPVSLPAGNHTFLSTRLSPATWSFIPKSGNGMPTQMEIKIYDGEGKAIAMDASAYSAESPDYGRFTASVDGEYYFFLRNPGYRVNAVDVSLDVDWRMTLVNGLQDFYGTLDGDYLDCRGPMVFSLPNLPPSSLTFLYEHFSMQHGQTMDTAARTIAFTTTVQGGWPSDMNVYITLIFTDPILQVTRNLEYRIDRVLPFIYVSATRGGAQNEGTITSPLDSLSGANNALRVLSQPLAAVLVEGSPAGTVYQQSGDVSFVSPCLVLGGWDGNASAGSARLMNPVMNKTIILLRTISYQGLNRPYYLQFTSNASNSVLEGFTIAQAAEIAATPDSPVCLLSFINNGTALISHNAIYAPKVHLAAWSSGLRLACAYVSGAIPLFSGNSFNPSDQSGYAGYLTIDSFSPQTASTLAASAITVSGAGTADTTIMNNEFYPVQITATGYGRVASASQSNLDFASSDTTGTCYVFGNTFHVDNGTLSGSFTAWESFGFRNTSPLVSFLANNNLLGEKGAVNPSPMGYRGTQRVEGTYLTNNTSGFQSEMAMQLFLDGAFQNLSNTDLAGTALTQGGTDLDHQGLLPMFLYNPTWLRNAALRDFNGRLRTAPWSIGAYEID